jgi:hypothetical protein
MMKREIYFIINYKYFQRERERERERERGGGETIHLLCRDNIFLSRRKDFRSPFSL